MNIICTVDILTRHIALPAGVQIASYDHNVDVIQFNIEPIEDFSLDTSTIRIAAQGPNKVRHDYAVDPSTVQIEEETGYITFDWPIPAGVTEMPIGTFKYGDRGQLIFAVCAEIISGSTLSKAWHSDDGIITVVAHLEPESGGGEDPEEEATNAQKIAQLQTNVAVMGTQVGALANGSPTPVATVAEMTDESAVYLYTGSETGYTAGNWYFWNGSAWTSGGTYGGAVTDTTLSVSGAPADAKAVGDTIDALDDRVTALESGSSGGLTADIKSALLACFANVAWANENGQTYYDALDAALNPPANLSSITAVYTQSGTVYDTASLDDLKPDLVVTAHWSDNTTSTITTYTLSGTLTAGTSTITVSYSGKTTTFTVTVSESVPSTYTKHGYIKLLSTSDKGRTNIPKARWIELRKYDNLNAISCEIEAQSDSLYTGTRPAMIGRRSASGYASSFAFYAGSNSSVLGGHLHGTEINQGPSFLQDVRNIIKYTNTSASPSSLKVNDGEAVSVVWVNNDTLNLAPVLFGNPVNDSNTDLSGSHRIGYIKIFDLSGDMIGYYIPVVRVADNVIGMYDVINQTFYTASTSSYATVGNSNCIYQVGEWS